MNQQTDAKPTCILVTGAPHAGTRLLANMLNQHPDVDAASHALGTTAELLAMMRFFVRSMQQTPVYSEEYAIDKTELFFVLDAYMTLFDRSKPYILIKVPYYVLNCLDMMMDYFDNRAILVFSHRPAEKVVASYLSRGEDTLFFKSASDEIFTQVKKLPVERRQHYLATADAPAFFAEVVSHSDALREQWNHAHPDHQFVDVDIQQMATSADYAREIVQQIGLEEQHIEAMLQVVDTDRLLQRQKTPAKHAHLKHSIKSLARSVTPPVLWAIMSNLRRTFRS